MPFSAEHFFEIFLKELQTHDYFGGYYKFGENHKLLAFRKAYFMQRLNYIWENIQNTGPENPILDIGCGYATTAIFLVLNGYTVKGLTLEFYFQHIHKRKEFWSQYGDISRLFVSYENLFDMPPEANSYQTIIVQDTLHHLEPLSEALKIIYNSLSDTGKLIAIEEDGSNIIQRAKLFLQRGNKRIIQIYDEKLQKHILLGNENIRNLSTWKSELLKQNLQILPESVQYIRYYLPNSYVGKSWQSVANREQNIWRNNQFLREYFFFGLNFIAQKKSTL